MKPYSPQYGLSLGRIFQKFGTLGKDYIPAPDAHDNFPALMQVYRDCAHTGAPLPVYEGGCENTIYGTPEATYAQRYLHDTVHAQLGLGFDIASEIAVSKEQLGMLGCVTPEEARTFLIDVGGQALYYVMTGELVEAQVTFCRQVYEDMRMLQECYPPDNENEIQLLTRAVRLYVNAFCYPNATRN